MFCFQSLGSAGFVRLQPKLSRTSYPLPISGKRLQYKGSTPKFRSDRECVPWHFDILCHKLIDSDLARKSSPERFDLNRDWTDLESRNFRAQLVLESDSPDTGLSDSRTNLVEGHTARVNFSVFANM